MSTGAAPAGALFRAGGYAGMAGHWQAYWGGLGGALPVLVGRLAIMCFNLEPLAAKDLTEANYGGHDGPLAKGVPPPTVPVYFLRRLVSCRVGSAGNTRANLSARVHLVVAIDR